MSAPKKTWVKVVKSSVAEEKILTPQQVWVPKSTKPVRRFANVNTRETRQAALSVYNKITKSNILDAQIQVDDFDEQNNIVILARHRDLPDGTLEDLRGIVIDLNRQIVLGRTSNPTPT